MRAGSRKTSSWVLEYEPVAVPRKSTWLPAMVAEVSERRSYAWCVLIFDSQCANESDDAPLGAFLAGECGAHWLQRCPGVCPSSDWGPQVHHPHRAFFRENALTPMGDIVILEVAMSWQWLGDVVYK